MVIKKICMLGGSGFVGRTLANKLSAAGYQVKILCRNREARREKLILLPGVELLSTDIHVEDNLRRHFDGCDAVINLVGILNERGRDGSGFHYVHVTLLEKIIRACKASNISRLLQMSALNADAEQGPSHYLRSKGEAEQLLFAETSLRVTCFRASVIFGRDDSFFNRFAALLKITPVLFPLACAQTRFAPVFVGDVAMAFVNTLNLPAAYGRHYCLCGPKAYSLQELLAYTAACLQLRRHIVALPDGLARVQAGIFDFIPGKPFSTDNYRSCKVDSLCAQNDLPALGVNPQALEAVVPSYLAQKTQRARYYQLRQH